MVQHQRFPSDQQGAGYILLASTIPPELFHGSACGLWMWTTTTSMSNHNKPQEDQEQTEEVCRRRKSTLNLKGKELRALFSPPTYLPHFACSHAWQIDWLASWLAVTFPQASWLAGWAGCARLLLYSCFSSFLERFLHALDLLDFLD